MEKLWKNEEFTAEQIKKNLAPENEVFKIPSYQRGAVWSEKQELFLIDTIKRGLPFGTLLLYKDTHNNTYQIIDGLQRSLSLCKFISNPAQFFNEDDINDNEAIKKIASYGNMEALMIKNHLIDWVKREHHTMEDVEGMQFADFAYYLAQIDDAYSGKSKDIGDAIKPMLKRYQDICKLINSTNIPAIVYFGDPIYLPMIFERINSMGTKLSKYQIYAATWDKKFKLTSNKKIVEANRDRYDNLLEGYGSIDDYDSAQFVTNMKLNAFELALGFGKVLSKNYPHLFGKSEDYVDVPSIGFTLMSFCLGVKNKDLGDLESKLDDRIVKTGKLDLFFTRIFDTVKYIDSIVGKYSKFKLNSTKKDTDAGKPLHTEFQIVSIIGYVFLLKYAIISTDSEDNVVDVQYDMSKEASAWTSRKDKFEKNVCKIYIMEALQKRWSGTGDAKMDGIMINQDYYSREVSKDDFKRALDNWFLTMNDERNEREKIASPKEPESLFLAALYINIFNANSQLDKTKYDIEHLATQKYMKEMLKKEEYSGLALPISSIGNLCLLPQFVNRSKKEKTLYDDQVYLEKIKPMTLADIEKNYSFTCKEDLDWTNNKTLDKDAFKKEYLKFTKKHFDSMETKLLEFYDVL